ncbi:hypothetical protein EPVG_00080 [Emiliania huxleyi virus 201]|nr:hypothetical protein ERVG_00112 [Emiliania huxleyi virus 208]AET97968.1 hypothetical protein EPVG_00080 [Emiliania huxleyi virus 201]
MLALTVCIATSFIGSTRYMHTTHTTHVRPYAFVPDLFEVSSLSVLQKDMSDVYLPAITGLTHIFNFYAIFLLFDLYIIPFYKNNGLLSPSKEEILAHNMFLALDDPLFTPITAEQYPLKEDLDEDELYYVGTGAHAKQYITITDDEYLKYDLVVRSREFSAHYDMDIMICKIVDN